MILLLDSGNSRVSWALESRGGLGEIGQQAWSDPRPLAAAWADLAAPQRIVAANVAGEDAERRMQQAAAERWGLAVEFAHSGERCCGLRNGYRDPARLGIDRWLAMIAAYHRVQGPVVVVDCGTAVTVDLVDADGRFRGGAILPGLRLARTALRHGTAGLGGGYEEAELTAAATSTGAGIVSGTRLGLAGAIERLAAEQAALVGGKVAVVLTGGDADGVLPLLRPISGAMPACITGLVLEGLALWAMEHTG